MYRIINKHVAACVVVAALALAACEDSTAPRMETASSLDVSAPAVVTAGESFALTVSVVGSEGSRPFAGVDGLVTLSASVGSITPETIILADGTGTGTVTLSAADGAVTITAAGAGLEGSREIAIDALALLPGNPGDAAVEAIPGLEFIPRAGDYGAHPDLGADVSFRVVMIAFDPTSTVDQANAVLAGMSATIAGGITGRAGDYPGVLMVRVPLTTHAEMDQLVDELNATAFVVVAAPDMVTATTMVPDSNPFDVATWLWEPLPSGGNWGLEISRAPQMWNLNAALERRGSEHVNTGVFDAGYDENHSDLTFARNFSPAIVHFHGTHVAGTIGADFGNSNGVDGITPFARLHGAASHLLSMGSALTGLEKLANAGCRVVNMSIGMEWPIDPTGSSILEAALALQADLFKSTHDGLLVGAEPPLIVAAAGNQGNDFATPVEARLGSAMNYAALELGSPHIIVVEAVEQTPGAGTGARRAAFSNVGGHVSAPGVSVLSTAPGNIYVLLQGTSMAAPHVTGLASYLLSIDPSLTNAQLTELIVRNATAADGNAGSPAANRIDAFATALDIDAIRSNQDVLKMLLDIDDGTVDGNQRVDYESGGDFTDADADGNGGIGDGFIDMSDFRRWRDHYLQYAKAEGRTLDGTAEHIKRDLNGNGKVGDPQEFVYPLADFNGDGTLDTLATAEMSGELFGFGALTDLQVLQSQFFDVDVQSEDLPGLVYSGDIHVDLSEWVADTRFTDIFSLVEIDGFDIKIDQRFHHGPAPTRIYTVPSNDGPYRVTAWGLDAFGDTLCTQVEVFEVSPGEDRYYKPPCPGVVIDITLAEFAERQTLTPVLVRAGVRATDGNTLFKDGMEIELSVTGGSLVATSGTTGADGFFATSASISATADEMTVFVTATDPASGASAVASATAKPLEDEGNSTVTLTGGSYFVDAHVQASVSDVHDIQNDRESGSPLEQPVFSASFSLSGNSVKETSSATATASAAGDFSVVTGGDSLMVISGSASGNASGEASGPLAETGSALGSGGGTSSMGVEFTVAGDPVRYIFQATATADPRDVGVTTSVRVSLVDGDNNTIHLIRDGDISQAGTLPPGRYLLTAQAQVSITSVKTEPNSGAADVTVHLSLF